MLDTLSSDAAGLPVRTVNVSSFFPILVQMLSVMIEMVWNHHRSHLKLLELYLYEPFASDSSPSKVSKAIRDDSDDSLDSERVLNTHC